MKYLKKEEIPVAFQLCFDFESQYTEKRGGTYNLTIKKKCLKCSTQRRVGVASTKQNLKSGKFSGLCSKCSLDAGRSVQGEKSFNWKGGRLKNQDGYVRARCPQHPNAQKGYVLEHRLVMEKHIGRLLTPSETVHHKNGIRDDNRIENLELWVKSHGEGQRYEDLSEDVIRDWIHHLQSILKERNSSSKT